jgi:sortase A
VLAGFAFVALGAWGFELLATRWNAVAQEHRLAELLASRGPADLAPAAAAARSATVRAAATRAEIGRSGLVGRLEIERLRLRVIVQEGADRRTLRHAAGHVPGTALPGEAGNVVVAAHRDTLFAPLEHIALGDRLRFVTPDGSFDYEVRDVRIVAPTETAVMAQGSDAEATLVTCHPFAYVGPAPRRFVVRAARVAGAGS